MLISLLDVCYDRSFQNKFNAYHFHCCGQRAEMKHFLLKSLQNGFHYYRSLLHRLEHYSTCWQYGIHAGYTNLTVYLISLCTGRVCQPRWRHWGGLIYQTDKLDFQFIGPRLCRPLVSIYDLPSVATQISVHKEIKYTVRLVQPAWIPYCHQVE